MCVCKYAYVCIMCTFGSTSYLLKSNVCRDLEFCKLLTWFWWVTGLQTTKLEFLTSRKFCRRESETWKQQDHKAVKAEPCLMPLLMGSVCFKLSLLHFKSALFVSSVELRPEIKTHCAIHLLGRMLCFSRPK